MARAATPPRVEGTALFWSRVSSHRDDEPDEVLLFLIQAPKYDSSANKSYTCGETFLKAASFIYEVFAAASVAVRAQPKRSGRSRAKSMEAEPL